MADRCRQTLLLLASRNDLVWLPAGALTTRAGLAPGAERACPDCGHGSRPGWLVDRFGRAVPCRRCGGAVEPTGVRGWVAKDGGSGRVAFDPMDVLQVDVGSETTTATARPRRRVACDRCGGDGVWKSGGRCPSCGGAGARDLHAFELRIDLEPPDTDPVDAAIDRRNAAGSYRELDRALDTIAARSDDDRRRVADLLAVVDAGEPLEAAQERTLLRLVALMPDPIRVPADVRLNERERADHRRRIHGRSSSPEALRQRDRDIRSAYRRRTPVQRIAFEFGLSVSQVNRVISGESP